MPHNLNRYIWLAFLIIATTPHLGRAQTGACSRPGLERAASEVAESRKTLLALPLGELPSDEVVVPPASAEAVRKMKDRLNNLVVAYMACLPVQETPDPEHVQQDLSRLAHAFKLRTGFIKKEDLPKDFGKYGFELWFEVRATPDARRLISITATFSIQCADDALLLIFSPRPASWQEVLRWQSKPYKKVDGAFWSFDYGISPPDRAGSWYVVTHYVNGWCASTWSAINYSVLRPAPGTPRPKVIFAKSDFMWWGGEDYGKLIVNRQYFDLRFHSASIDTDVHNRVFIRHYAVDGDVVRRIQPVAVSPRDFVDEWMVSKWADAQTWSASADLQKLELIHEELSKLHTDPKPILFYFDSAQKCRNSSDGFQIALSVEDHGTFYFRVETHPSLSMISAKEAPDPDCTGRNLLDDMATR
jgi:hypothetical protein